MMRLPHLHAGMCAWLAGYYLRDEGRVGDAGNGDADGRRLFEQACQHLGVERPVAGLVLERVQLLHTQRVHRPACVHMGRVGQ
jgi:hypothetical protein